MKCSNCGSNNLTKGGVPFYVTGDAWLELNPENVFICLECGHVEFFNMGFVENYKQKQNEIMEIQSEMKNIQQEIEKLKSIPFDKNKYEQKIKNFENEIKTLESLSVSPREIRSRQDGINDCDKIIKSGIDPDIANKINHLSCKYQELNNKLSKL